jgi:hypothetical protein
VTGLLPPDATISEINSESQDDLPVQDIDVRITDAQTEGDK